MDNGAYIYVSPKVLVLEWVYASKKINLEVITNYVCVSKYVNKPNGHGYMI